jgi:hypothetical protein
MTYKTSIFIRVNQCASVALVLLVHCVKSLLRTYFGLAWDDSGLNPDGSGLLRDLFGTHLGLGRDVVLNLQKSLSHLNAGTYDHYAPGEFRCAQNTLTQFLNKCTPSHAQKRQRPKSNHRHLYEENLNSQLALDSLI